MEITKGELDKYLIKLTIRLKAISKDIKSTKWFVEQLEKSNCITIRKAWFIYENKNKDGEDVPPHYHGYLEIEMCSMPTFRNSFKKNILKLNEFTTHKKGNGLYCISILRKEDYIYLSYMNKNIHLLPYAPIEEDWGKSEVVKYQVGIDYNLYHRTRDYWLKIKDEKNTIKEVRAKLAADIKALQIDFKSTNNWVFSVRSIHEKQKKSLCEEFIKIYVRHQVQFRSFQVKMKLELWWLTKYPDSMKKYVERYF